MRIQIAIGAALCVSGCFGFDHELVDHPSFGTAIGMSYRDQARYQGSLEPVDQVAFFIYMNHTMRPPNLLLREELANAGPAVFDEVVIRLDGSRDDFDMASLADVLQRQVTKGISIERRVAARDAVSSAASRATIPAYKEAIEKCRSEIEAKAAL